MYPELYHAISNMGILVEAMQHETLLTPLMPMNLLISFKYLAGQVKLLERLIGDGVIANAMLDAQTFEINPGGHNVTGADYSEAYMRTISKVSHLFHWFASYDVDFAAPLRNQEKDYALREYCADMTARDGVPVTQRIMPVVHDNKNPEEEFELYQSYGVERIAIGSQPDLSEDQWKAINILRREHNMPIHKFGNMGNRIFDQIMPESADSSRFAGPRRFGYGVFYWDDVLKKDVTVDIRKKGLITDEQRSFFNDRFGLTLEQITNDVVLSWIANLYAIEMKQRYLRDVLYPSLCISEGGEIVPVAVDGQEVS